MTSFRHYGALPLASILLAITGCGSNHSVNAGAMAPSTEPEPTGSFVPTPTPAPLFDLLTVSGDFDTFATARELIKAMKPAGIVQGTVEDVAIGGTEVVGPSGAGQSQIETATLGIRPLAQKGKVAPGADRLIHVELYRSPLVTAEWLRLATEYQGRKCLFLLADHPVAQKAPSPGLNAATASLVHPQALYCTGLGADRRLRSSVAGRDAPVPSDIGSVSPETAFARLQADLPSQ